MTVRSEVWEYHERFNVDVSSFGNLEKNGKKYRYKFVNHNGIHRMSYLLIADKFLRHLTVDETIHFTDGNKSNWDIDNMVIIHSSTKESLKAGKYTGISQHRNGYAAKIRHKGELITICNSKSFDIAAMEFKKFVLNNDVNINYMHLIDDYEYNTPSKKGEIWKYWKDGVSISNFGKVANYRHGRDSNYYGLKDSSSGYYLLDLDRKRHQIKDIMWSVFNNSIIPDGQTVINLGNGNYLRNLFLVSKITKRWLRSNNKQEYTGVVDQYNGWNYIVNENYPAKLRMSKSEEEAARKFKQWVIDNNINTNLMTLIEG